MNALLWFLAGYGFCWVQILLASALGAHLKRQEEAQTQPLLRHRGVSGAEHLGHILGCVRCRQEGRGG